MLCATAADVAAAETLVSSGARLVALTAAAWLEADRRMGRSDLLEDFYSEQALSDLRMPVLEREIAWMDWLDRLLAERVPAIGEHDLRVCRLWFYCLKRLIDPLLVLGFTTGSLFDRLRPSSVWLSAADATEPAWHRFFRVGPHGRMEIPHFSLPAVARQIAARAGVRIEYLQTAKDREQPPAGGLQRSGLRPLARRLAPPWALDAIGLFRRIGPAGLRHLLPRVARRGLRLLVVRGGYDLDLLIDEAVRRGCRVDFWSRVEARALDGHGETAGAKTVDACARLWPELDATSAFQQPFRDCGFDAYGFARSGLEHFITRVVPDTLRYYLAGRASIRRGGYRAVLAPAAMRATALLAAARAERVPVVIYQHGGFVGTCEHLIWDFADLAHADRLITYGDGVKTYFEERKRRWPHRTAEIAVAGSARLDAQVDASSARERAGLRGRLEADPARRLVLYVATFTSGYSRMIAAESYPETLCFRRQVDVMDLMRGCAGVTFIFKPYSDRDSRMIQEMLVRRGVANCRIVSDMPLLDLMQVADAIAVEFPSTALLEAAVSGKPLAVYVDRESLRLEPAAASALHEGAIVAETHADFLAAIRRLADGSLPDAMSRGARRYAREYALDRSAGPAAARAFGVLAEAAGF